MSLLTGLISHYKMDEASGSALDAHGSNPLADNNSVGTGTGKINGARQFNAASSRYLSHAAIAGIKTVSGWVYLDSKGSYRFFFAQLSDTSYDFQVFYDQPSDRLGAQLGDGGTNIIGTVFATSLGSPSINTWYHVVMRDHGATMSIRVNGGTIDSAAVTGSRGTATASFTIGARAYPTSELYHDGRLDEVDIYSRAITDQETLDIYNGGNGLPYSSYAGAQTYTLTAAQGSFTLTGQSAALKINRRLTAAQGSFALTGQTAAFPVSRRLTAAQGAFTLSGQDVSLRRAITMTAGQGSYVLTGQDAALRRGKVMVADGGSFALTGNDVAFHRAIVLAANQGTFNLTGLAANLNANIAGSELYPPFNITVTSGRQRLEVSSGQQNITVGTGRQRVSVD